MKIINIHTESLNETEEVLFIASNVSVVVDYFWDSHGRLVEWDGPNGQSRDEFDAESVKIVEKKWDMKMYDTITPMSCWEAYIDGNKIQALDIREYNLRKRLFIKAIVGTG